MTTAPDPNPDPNVILQYWFGELDGQGQASPEKVKGWFSSTPDRDAEIRDRFEPVIETAARGELDTWLEGPRPTVALVVLLDQFPRNIHRKTPRAFSHDEAALTRTQFGLDAGYVAELPCVMAAFMLMPLMHSESLLMQARAVQEFEALAAAHEGGPHAKRTASFADFARQHRDIIERFGRFPHRNRALGRTSTPEEIDYMKEGSGFGQ